MSHFAPIPIFLQPLRSRQVGAIIVLAYHQVRSLLHVYYTKCIETFIVTGLHPFTFIGVLQ